MLRKSVTTLSPSALSALRCIAVGSHPSAASTLEKFAGKQGDQADVSRQVSGGILFRLFSCSPAQLRAEERKIGPPAGEATALEETSSSGLANDLEATRWVDDDEGEFGLADVPSSIDGERNTGAMGPLQSAFREWSKDFRMKIIDVNRTSRGSPTGGIGRFAAIVVVGNGHGVLGFGTGKSTAMGEALKKANRQAMKTLFFVPRYENTILHPVVSTYKKCKVTMYPKSTGSGCKTSPMIKDICHLAGIFDIGIKCHGTRNLRNTVKALIRGFESQTIPEEQHDLPINKELDEALERQTKKIRGVPTRQTAGLISIPRRAGKMPGPQIEYSTIDG